MRRSHLRALPIKTLAPGILALGCVWAAAMEGGQMQSAPGGQGGTSTAGVFAPVHDAANRPITAGGFVDSGPVVFADDSRSSGLAAWRYSGGTPEKQFIVESLGGGVALLDYDHDGWLDIYLVNGMTYDAMTGKAQPPHAALFHNNHDGTFTNVASRAGVTNDRWGVGVAVGDYDNDGWPDLYVTNVNGNRLYRNNHDGTFTDVAVKAGVALGDWSTGPTFGDYDGDGRLDLFVPGYVVYDFSKPPAPGSDQVVSNNCRFRGVSVFCGPRGLRGEHDHLFHNNGDGTFTDVSRKAGVDDAPGYYGLTSLFVDLDGDGRPDLLVANDSTPNYLYRNKGDGAFEDLSFESGYAVNGDGRPTASMGIAVGDDRNSGSLDIVNTDFSDDYDVLYRNAGDLTFNDASRQAGIAETTIPFLGWGVGFLDFDNDGWKDLFIGNGHVYPQVDQHDWGTTFAERPLLFRNTGNGKFAPVPAVKGSGLAGLLTARGVAFGDLFNNGRIDVVVNNLDGTPTLLRNVDPDRHHWIEFSLVGGPKSPRDAVGATVFLTANGTRQRGDVLSGGSFASSSDPRVHFGLGDATAIQKLEVRWPDRSVEEIAPGPADCIDTIQENRGVTARFCPAASTGKSAGGAMKRLPLLLLLLAAPGALAQATSVRVADAPCARCHEKIYQSYLDTPMANASGAAADNLKSGTYLHQASGIAYTIQKAGGAPTLTWHDTRSLQGDQQATLSYFLGSGHLGITWLYSVDRYLFESPVAWYAATNKLDMKPGLEKAGTRLPALPIESACLRCHMSAVQRSDPGSINRYSGLPFLHAGITCEACHGDTRQHVLSGGKSPVVDPASLHPDLRDSVCISCHLEGDVSVERAGRNALDYRPGQPISGYLAYYVYAKSDPNARGVSEVEQFSRSMCKRMSGDRMSCTSCHDPHYTPAASERAAFFRKKCLACHSGSFAVSHHPENPDCTSCHMPHNGAQNIPHVAWTDHRILRLPEPSLPADSQVGNQLTPIFSPGATQRDLGMAYYLALAQGNHAAEPLAWSLLHGQREALSSDPPALDALAELDAERGNYQDAEAEFRRVLVLEPADVTALSNLGTLLARQGNLSQATQLLQQAFDRNSDLGGLAMNLARVQCAAGDAAGETQTLRTVLRYNPGVARIRQQLASACAPSAQKASQP